MTSSISSELLVPFGKALLLGAFAWSLTRSIQGRLDLHTCFERLAIGLLAILSFKSASSLIEQLSNQLHEFISGIYTGPGLRELLIAAFKKAAAQPRNDGTPTTFNIPALAEQAWRTGVWGVMNALVEGVFVIVYFTLECAKEVLWKILLLLFPIAAGLYPIFPRMLTNAAIYSFELSLWFPLLELVEKVTGQVAIQHMSKDGSWGLYIVAVQTIAIVLILMIPSLTHHFLSGAFSGDLNSHSNLLRWSKLGISEISRVIK